MTNEETKNTLKKVYEILRSNNVWAEAYEELGMVAVEINWGDWKHDHLRAEWLMKENGFKQLFEEVTEEDGSDTYSAIHYFVYS